LASGSLGVRIAWRPRPYEGFVRIEKLTLLDIRLARSCAKSKDGRFEAAADPA
jgi:hypothetical protein